LVFIPEHCDDQQTLASFFILLHQPHNEKILDCSLHVPYTCFFFYTGTKLLTPMKEINKMNEHE